MVCSFLLCPTCLFTRLLLAVRPPGSIQQLVEVPFADLKGCERAAQDLAVRNGLVTGVPERNDAVLDYLRHDLACVVKGRSFKGEGSNIR